MKIEKLILVIVFGVIIADLVAHVAGTTEVFKGLNLLWGIGTQPTNTANIKTTPVANN